MQSCPQVHIKQPARVPALLVRAVVCVHETHTDAQWWPLQVRALAGWPGTRATFCVLEPATGVRCLGGGTSLPAVESACCCCHLANSFNAMP
jgi:hypothetical protein